MIEVGGDPSPGLSTFKWLNGQPISWTPTRALWLQFPTTTQVSSRILQEVASMFRVGGVRTPSQASEPHTTLAQRAGLVGTASGKETAHQGRQPILRCQFSSYPPWRGAPA